LGIRRVLAMSLRSLFVREGFEKRFLERRLSGGWGLI
jgi:hypothetical protein